MSEDGITFRLRGKRKIYRSGDVSFCAGSRSVSLDAVHWFPAESLMGLFVLGWSFLDWVARDCPMFTVASVDEENGVVTLEKEGL